MFKKNIIKVITVSAFTIVLGKVYSQPPPPPPGPCADPPCEIAVPVDGGIGLLIAAGVAYGAKKLNDRKKRKQFQD